MLERQLQPCEQLAPIRRAGGEHKWWRGGHRDYGRGHSISPHSSPIFFDSNGPAPYDCAPMSRDPLPKQVDIRKMASAGATLAAEQPLAAFPRFADMLAASDGDVLIDLAFARDQQGIVTLEGHVQAQVSIACQRCLEPMPHRVDSRFRVGVVWNEEQARQLPRSLEPLIVEEERYDLTTVIEDELIISLPYTSYHSLEQCGERARYLSTGEEAAPEDEKEGKENPFQVLEKLKPGH